MNLGGRRWIKKILILTQIQFSIKVKFKRAWEKKKLFYLNINLVKLHYFSHFCGNSQCDTLIHLGPNCNLRLKPRQGALLEERFQRSHRKLKQSSWHDAELAAKAKAPWREGCCCQGWVQGSVLWAWALCDVPRCLWTSPLQPGVSGGWDRLWECDRDTKFCSASNTLCCLSTRLWGHWTLLETVVLWAVIPKDVTQDDGNSSGSPNLP